MCTDGKPCSTETKPAELDQEEAYQREIAPLVEQIAEKCRELKIPALLAFCTKFKEMETDKGQGVDAIVHVMGGLYEGTTPPSFDIAEMALQQNFKGAALLALVAQKVFKTERQDLPQSA